MSFKLSIGKTAIAGEVYTNEAIAGLIPKDKERLIDKYLFQIFTARFIDLESTGNKIFGKSLNSAILKDDVKIPIPPLDIQQKIVNEIEELDKNKSHLLKEGMSMKDFENVIKETKQAILKKYL